MGNNGKECGEDTVFGGESRVMGGGGDWGNGGADLGKSGRGRVGDRRTGDRTAEVSEERVSEPIFYSFSGPKISGYPEPCLHLPIVTYFNKGLRIF